MSYKGIDWAFEGGFGLIITLDCGIKAIDKAEYAKSKGVDMIICDHHLPEDTIPAAVAVLDPKREDCHYPFDDLSGCGVGFKLVQAYASRYGVPFETLVPLLDLLVVSIASDLVTMVGENRTLAHYGLKQLNEDPHKGLLAMINLANIERPWSPCGYPTGTTSSILRRRRGRQGRALSRRRALRLWPRSAGR